MTKRDKQDVNRAIAAIDRIQKRLGDSWDDYKYDELSSARAMLVNWLEKHEG
jgi:hypothetical protein